MEIKKSQIVSILEGFISFWKKNIISEGSLLEKSLITFIENFHRLNINICDRFAEFLFQFSEKGSSDKYNKLVEKKVIAMEKKK